MTAAVAFPGKERGARGYQRRFDHDEARRRYAAGESVAALAREYGVTESAVYLVVSAKQAASARALHERYRTADRCERCGAVKSLFSRYTSGSRLCRSCAMDDRATSVREGELRCSSCGEWKPDDDFPRNRSARLRRRGRHNQCRSCQTNARQAYRERHKVPCVGCGAPALPPSEKGPKGASFPRCRECASAGVCR